jgi:hypothetical protein
MSRSTAGTCHVRRGSSLLSSTTYLPLYLSHPTPHVPARPRQPGACVRATRNGVLTRMLSSHAYCFVLNALTLPDFALLSTYLPTYPCVRHGLWKSVKCGSVVGRAWAWMSRGECRRVIWVLNYQPSPSHPARPLALFTTMGQGKKRDAGFVHPPMCSAC